jgi:hypothetical protein
MSNNYWIVGASWGGKEDALSGFLERGYWYCWDPKKTSPEDQARASVKAQQELFRQIKKTIA